MIAVVRRIKYIGVFKLTQGMEFMVELRKKT
jgi:hypothetical protein